jgi:hypothetical protein
MDTIENLIYEIKSSNISSVYESELNKYVSRYQNYYRENVLTNPTKGFSAVIGWYDQRRKEFYEEFKKLGISIKDDPIAPLHDYEHQLKQTGMNRLSELERKLK